MLIKKSSCPPATETALPVGTVVRSLGGRDRKRVFVVTGQNPVTVADGALRTLGQGKRKNPKHLTVVGALPAADREILENNPTDEAIRRMVGKFDEFSRETEK